MMTTLSDWRPEDYPMGDFLLDAVTGAFTARRSTLNKWCANDGATPRAVRKAILADKRSDDDNALIERVIRAAGAELVDTNYRYRLWKECSHLMTVRSGVEAIPR